jgi:uncharacterized low-complexity protein
MKRSIKSVAAAVGAVTLSSLALMPVAQAADASPFALNDLGKGYQVAASHAAKTDAPAADAKKGEGKCGEGKCGGDKAKKEGKCGEGKCGGKK